MLAFRSLILNGLYVLLCALKRDANESVIKLGNSKDCLFECRAIFQSVAARLLLRCGFTGLLQA